MQLCPEKRKQKRPFFFLFFLGSYFKEFDHVQAKLQYDKTLKGLLRVLLPFFEKKKEGSDDVSLISFADFTLSVSGCPV